MSEGQKTLFIICPLKSKDSPTRIRSDQLRRHIIEPAAKAKGYSVVRSDTQPDPGRIDNQIVDHLLDDDLVVCDLTEQNPNVLYELAIRHAIKKPVILLGERDTLPPFDLYSQRVISYDLTNPDKVEESKEELIKQIEAIEKDTFIVDSPIRGTESIVQSRTHETNASQEMMNILRNLSDRMRILEEKIEMQFREGGWKLLSKDSFPGFVVEAARSARDDWIPISKLRVCPNCKQIIPEGLLCVKCGFPLTSENDTKKS